MARRTRRKHSMVVVAQELVRYLLAHPGASDTAEGIARWWFESEDGVSPLELKKALDHLVAVGLIEASSAGDGRVRYRRRAGAAALRAFLRAA